MEYLGFSKRYQWSLDFFFNSYSPMTSKFLKGCMPVKLRMEAKSILLTEHTVPIPIGITENPRKYKFFLCVLRVFREFREKVILVCCPIVNELFRNRSILSLSDTLNRLTVKLFVVALL